MELPSLKTVLRTVLGVFVFVNAMSAAVAQIEPNSSYSSFYLSYSTTTFANPVCIGNECHTGVSGPALAYSYQFVPNLAVGVSGSSAQSLGNSSSLKLTGGSIFVEAVMGVGSYMDIGAIASPLFTTLEKCSTLTSACTSTDNAGTDIGVFGKFFISEHKATSIELGYDAVSYQNSPGQLSIIGISLVTVLAEHHRLALSASHARDSNGNATSDNFGYGYSYLF